MSDENITFDNNVSDTDSSEASFYDEFSLCTDVTKLKPYEFEPLVSSMESEVDLDDFSNQVEEVSQSTRVGNVQWCECDSCEAMNTDHESLCCVEANEIPDDFFEGKIQILFEVINMFHFYYLAVKV